MCFNLVDERWIPVLHRDGRFERVGIQRALTESGRIRQIAASNPLDNVALLRFLLAVMLWCRGDLTDEDLASLNDSADGIPGSWLKNLDEHKAKFNLLGDGERFMQAPACANKDRPVADLYHELPGATNISHLRHIEDYRDGLCPACIAIGLIRQPVAITGKGAGKRPGINGDPPLYYMPIGRTLLGTLALNWPTEGVDGDRPCWEKPCTQHQVGIMEGFTWTSRQFRIAGHAPGTCMMCGSCTDRLVTKLRELNKPNGRKGLSRCTFDRWQDLHIIYDDKGKPGKMEDAVRDPSGSSGQWRDWLAALHADNTNGIKRPKAVASAVCRRDDRVPVLVAGLANQGQDKSLEACSCTLSICHRDDGVPADVKTLDDAIVELLDPRVTLKGKKLSQFKAKHPLRVIRHDNPPLPDSVRSALANRLPTLELAMFAGIQSRDNVSVGTPRDVATATAWCAVVSGIVKSTTPGSPLRRRAAMNDAQASLNKKITELARKANNASAEAEAGGDTPTKPKRSRKKTKRAKA